MNAKYKTESSVQSYPAKWLPAFIKRSHQGKKETVELLQLLHSTTRDRETAKRIKEFMRNPREM